ncbi:hypothetical protein HYU45_02955 [Candidatus Daviesbacteria bacterium]|nr:hypothetical protein [Candidatus Daviesbacteria bacterium]
MAIVISADEIKKELKGYTPNLAEKFHAESAKMADQEFEKEIKNTSYKEIILVCGGSASGKSEFLATQLADRESVIFDGTLSSTKRAERKLKKIIKESKTPIIYAVIPDDLKRAFIAFLRRDRKFRDTHFYRTHSSSRKTLLWIALNYPKVEINIVESSYTSSKGLQFIRIKLDNRQKLIEYLIGLQMTEDDIIKQTI